MNLIDVAHQYRELVGDFRTVTDSKSPSGMCCEEVVDGRPACCDRVVQGVDRLTFTASELMLLTLLWSPPPGVFETRDVEPAQHHTAVYTLDVDALGRETTANEIDQGWLANTLESAAHPLRPIIGLGGKVMGVVAIDGCNTRVALSRYHLMANTLRAMWQMAVDLTGPKPYYVTYDIKPEWTLL